MYPYTARNAVWPQEGRNHPCTSQKSSALHPKMAREITGCIKARNPFQQGLEVLTFSTEAYQSVLEF